MIFQAYDDDIKVLIALNQAPDRTAVDDPELAPATITAANAAAICFTRSISNPRYGA